MPVTVLIACFEVPGYGGASTATYSLHQALETDGIDPHLLNLIRDEDLPVFTTCLGDKFANPLGLPKVNTIFLDGPENAQQERVTALIERIDPDVMLAVGRIAANVLGGSCRSRPLIFLTAGIDAVMHDLRGEPLVDACTVLASPDAPGRYGFHKELEALNRSDLVITHSGLVLSLLQKLYPVCRPKLHPEPIWYSDWIVAEAEKHSALRRGFEQREIDVVFIASSWERAEKNYDFVECVAARLPDLAVHVVGRVPRTIAGVKHEGFTNRRRTFEILGNSKVLICPSLVDAAPGVLFEACVMGCNIVTSRNSGNWQLCADQFVVPGWDPDKWVEVIRNSISRAVPCNLGMFAGFPSYRALRNLLESYARSARFFHAQADRPLGIGYHLWHYPALSESFIQREIAAVRRTGVPITVIAEDRDETTPLCETGVQQDRHILYLSQEDCAISIRRAVLKNPFRAAAAYGYTRISRYHENKSRVFDRETFRLALKLAGLSSYYRLPHLHAPWGDRNAFITGLAARIAGITHSVQVRAHDLHRDNYRIGLRARLRGARFVVTNTDYNLSVLRKLLGPRRSRRVHRIYNTIDRISLDGRRNPAPDGAPLRILSVGRLVPQKGHTTLIEAIARLRGGGRQVALKIIGAPEPGRRTEYQQEMRDLIATHGLGSCVELAGAQPFDTVLQAYRDSDVFVLACEIDSDGSRDITPNALIEAMAMRLPVISTRVTGIPEIVDHEQNGILTHAGDIEGLATAIARLQDDTGLRQRYGEAAREKALSRFGGDTQARSYAALFRDAVTSRRN